MKKLNNYLLTNYPLAWNLRLHWLWPVILLLHLLFWLAGYGSVSFPESASYYSLEPGGATFSMTVLCGLLLLALWLIFYFRNNAFKSFYPLAKGRLVAEFGLILLTTFGLTTFVASYAGGTYFHIRQETREVDLVTEANTVNLAHHFLPFSRERFSVKADCNYDHSSRQEAVATPIRSSDGDTVAGNGITTDTFSYLHYCANMDGYYYIRYRYNSSGYSLSLASAGANDTVAKRWLYGGRRDSVAQMLTRFLAICKKYGAGYQYDVGKGVAEIFATPGFLVRGIISEDQYSAEHFDENKSRTEAQLQAGSYIETRVLMQSLTTIGEARKGWMRPDMMLVFLYFSLGIALLIFSFRATSVRVWFIALIGTAVWMAIFGVLAAATHGNGTSLMILFLLLSIGFLIGAGLQIARRASRRNAGIMLLWALWSFPALGLIVAGLIKQSDNEDYYSSRSTQSAYYWVQEHWTLINYLNLTFTVAVVCLLFIPLLRRWQAAPEE